MQTYILSISISNANLIPDALIYIASKNLIHGDIKPGNILVSNRDGRLRAVVGDFGLTGKSGGTPLFMAPEGLNSEFRVVVKTDLYSFSMTVLFLLFPVDLALKLLFLPIEENWDVFNENLSRFRLLFWVYINSSSDPEARPNFESLNLLIDEIRKFGNNWLRNKISSEILTENDVDLKPLNKALKNNAGFFYFIREHFGSDIRSSRVSENEAYKMSTAISKIQNLSLLESKVELGLVSKG